MECKTEEERKKEEGGRRKDEGKSLRRRQSWYRHRCWSRCGAELVNIRLIIQYHYCPHNCFCSNMYMSSIALHLANKYFGTAYIKILPPQDLYIPVLAKRTKNKLT